MIDFPAKYKLAKSIQENLNRSIITEDYTYYVLNITLEPDGFIDDFYLIFTEETTPNLFKLFHIIEKKRENSTMSQSQLTITLIPNFIKKGP